MASVPFPSSPQGAGAMSQGTTPHRVLSSTDSNHTVLRSSTSSISPSSRTIAILTKACAKVHRLAIESKLNAAGFEILLSRFEEWKYPDDVDFLEEFLFGHSEIVSKRWIDRLSNQSIYLMVLERSNAVQTWLDLIGSSGDEKDENDGGKGKENTQDDEDDEEADLSFNSFMSSSSSGGLSGAKLRTIYGKHLLYGSITSQQAQRQIAICAPDFASEDAIAELELSMCADQDDQEEEEEEVAHQGNQVILTEDDLVYNEQGEAFDANTGDQLDLQEELVQDPTTTTTQSLASSTSSSVAPAVNRTPTAAPTTFKARPIAPASLDEPKIKPRLSRAAALRMGIELPTPPKRTVATTSDVPVGISGLPKTEVARPKSLAEPTMKPRGNRASLARTSGRSSIISPPMHTRNLKSSTSSNGSAASSPTKEIVSPDMRPRKEVDFSSTPGHRNKRSSLSTVQLASLKPPTTAPRLNKAALARVGGGSTSTTSSSHGQSSALATTSHARSSSLATTTPSTSGRVSPVKPTLAGTHSSSSSSVERIRKPVDFSNTPGHKRNSLSTSGAPIASLAQPKILPRTNLAAMRRLSHGGVGVSSPIKPSGNLDTIPGSRPLSSMAFSPKSSITTTTTSRPKVSQRPSSSAGVRSISAHLPHQDGAESSNTTTARNRVVTGGRHGPPPTSFKVPAL
ncbi:unnamed protein product [Sympodiomycopsis kandeliae]